MRPPPVRCVDAGRCRQCSSNASLEVTGDAVDAVVSGATDARAVTDLALTAPGRMST